LSSRWQQLFRFCVLRLGLSPAAFWQLTVPELETLIEAMNPQAGTEFPDRAWLDEMITCHPDV